jgi:GTP-binding protein EngB required for normal cell division
MDSPRSPQFFDDRSIVYDALAPLWQDLRNAVVSVHAQHFGMTDPKRVCFVGRFKTGKSRLINALVGADVLPYNTDECTAQAIELTYGDKEHAACLVGSDLDHAIEKPLTIEQFTQATDLTAASHKKISNVNVGALRRYLPCSLLQNIKILDTPGFDGTNADARKEAEQAREYAIRQSHLCVLVLSAGLGADDVKCARLVKAYGIEMAVVLNQADKYDTEDIQEMQEQIVSDIVREVGVKPSFHTCSALWQNGSEEDRKAINYQRRFFDEADQTQWHQWEGLVKRLTRPIRGERNTALVAAIRQTFDLAAHVEKHYDLTQQAEMLFLNHLPRWKAMMPSLVGQTVLEMAINAARSKKPLPWKRLENFAITPDMIAPKSLVPQGELEQFREWYTKAIPKILVCAKETQSAKLYQAVLSHSPNIANGLESVVQEAQWYSQPLRTDFSYAEALKDLQFRWHSKSAIMNNDCAQIRKRLAASLV